MTLFHVACSETLETSTLGRVQEVFEPIMNLFVDRVGEAPLSLDMRVRLLPGAAISVHTSTPLRGTRTDALIARDGNDDLNFGLSLSGSVQVRQRGGPEITVQPGRGVLWENDRSGHSRTSKSTLVNITMPRAVLAPGIGSLDAALNEGLKPSMALKLLTGYAYTLVADNEVMTVEEEKLAAVHLRDLAALVLGPTEEAAMVARERGVRAARLKAIKADIEVNLAEENLSLDRIARRHHISPRYVRALFAMEGTSFTDYVLSRRLERAHHMLIDPRNTGCSICTVAYDVGFNDLSYFGRAFRRRFGMTPSDARATGVTKLGSTRPVPASVVTRMN